MSQKYQIRKALDEAIELAQQKAPTSTGGKWLESLIEDMASFIKDWDIEKCQAWEDWDERQQHFPDSPRRDSGIDLVAVRRSDGAHIAIQSKSRQLDETNSGNPINYSELGTFIGLSAADFWEERWVVTNGNCPLGGRTGTVDSMTDKPIKLVNVVDDLIQQRDKYTDPDPYCPHCDPTYDGEAEARQTRTCMQSEVIETSVRLLREHAESDSGGLPKGQARGKIILPCGTGKTRIALRIIEELTPIGGLSIVLCPSIALVAQIRSEFLQNAKYDFRPLAVCSDKTAGYDPKKEDKKNTAFDPTQDNSNVSASNVKGKVTTNPAEIAEWIREGVDGNQISVIFGTYQSGRSIADSLKICGQSCAVLVADEAHRTAGVKRKRRTPIPKLTNEEERIRDFTLCHDNNAFPATYRIYQTATPRIYDTHKLGADKPSDWIVRSMDDEQIFGVELVRKSYVEAVKNGWLSDYRIIALGTNDRSTYDAAYKLATNTQSAGRGKLTSADYLRGLAYTLAMGGATQNSDKDSVKIRSCIAFMNTVHKSKHMAEDLQSDVVRNWLQNWLDNNLDGKRASLYSLEHLDATHNVIARKNAIRRLGKASQDEPHGIINVGIFGEGTDSPSLSAVAFLESRKSPVDVVQAVGRAMRVSPDKELGYIICPILVPPNVDPEKWISTSAPEDGWQELGQILRALRAHDSRIEDELSDLMHLYLPAAPEEVHTILAIAKPDSKRIRYGVHVGAPGEAELAMERVLSGQSSVDQEIQPLSEMDVEHDERQVERKLIDATLILAGKNNSDGGPELREDGVVRDKPSSHRPIGKINFEKTKKKARDMINKGTGRKVKIEKESKKKQRRSHRDVVEDGTKQMLVFTGLDELGDSIKMNLLSKSGLIHNRIARDLNILESSIKEASFHLEADELGAELNKHFGLTNLNQKALNAQASGVTIAALLMMNAAMLHQRIAGGGWLSGISDLASIKNHTQVITRMRRSWEQIRRHDFRPVLEPAVNVIETIEDTGKLAGLERALRHIASEAERIAETYADMGADHAGPLFNRVMGNQQSDGAFFTRPTAGSIASRLALDAYGQTDWSDRKNWHNFKIVDLACGSGTLLASILTDMKRRALEDGAKEDDLAELQRIAVEQCIKGIDINPVSLQLAASQLTSGNQNIRYRSMGLHLMPYGPSQDIQGKVSAGSLELLGQEEIVAQDEIDELAEEIDSQAVWESAFDAELEDAVAAVQNADIVIINPPFTNRAGMGEKFSREIQKGLRTRTDALEEKLVTFDSRLTDFVDKNSIQPLFVALADRCLSGCNGVLAMVVPTIMLSAASAAYQRKILAQRYQIISMITCHLPGQINMSQNTSINESIVILRKKSSSDAMPAKIINLDRFPADDTEVAELHDSVLQCEVGTMAGDWGEVSHWPAERINAGDWTAAIWRSPELAEASANFASNSDLKTIEESGFTPAATGRILRGAYESSRHDIPGSFPILKSKSTDGQMFIESKPDEYWIRKTVPETKDGRINLRRSDRHSVRFPPPRF